MKVFLTLMAAALCLTALASLPACAQDEGLYDPVAPEGSAFVRFIHAGIDANPAEPSIKGKKYGTVDQGSVSAYFPVKAGSAEIVLGTNKAEQDLEKGGVYTAALKGRTFYVLKDDPLADPAKALITFYNLSDKAGLALKTTDGKVEIVGNVATGGNKSREINGIPVNLAIYADGAKVADIGEVILKRGEVTAVILLTTPEGSLKASAHQSRTDTTQ